MTLILPKGSYVVISGLLWFSSKGLYHATQKELHKRVWVQFTEPIAKHLRNAQSILGVIFSIISIIQLLLGGAVPNLGAKTRTSFLGHLDPRDSGSGWEVKRGFA